MQIAVDLNLTDAEVEAIERRGKRNKRSLKAEVNNILKAVALQEIGPDPLEEARRIRASTVGLGFNDSTEEIRKMRARVRE